MKIKLLAVTAVLATAVLCLTPAGAMAAQLTQAQINAIIELLQSFGADVSTIANVKTALGNETQSSDDSLSWCHTFNMNLGIGSYGDEVDGLVKALKKEGLLSSTRDNYSNFDKNLAEAVIKFQAKYKISKTGYLGAVTRTKLNKLYGCKIANACVSGQTKSCKEGETGIQTCVNGHWGACVAKTTQPSITVTSPNGGETWKVGETHNITWNTSGFTGQTMEMIDLLNSAGSSVISIASYLQNTGTYAWKIPSNISPGNYKIKVTIGGTGTQASDQSDNYFTVASSATAQCINCTDMNGDGLITPTDSIYVINRIGKCNGGVGYDQKADIDGDGCITDKDATCVQNQLGTRTSPGVCQAQTTTATPSCPTNMSWNATILQPVSSQYPYGRGYCTGTPSCPTNMSWNATILQPVSSQYPYGRGYCTGTPSCPTGTTWNATAMQPVSSDFPYGRGACVGSSSAPCPAGQDAYGSLCIVIPSCLAGQVWDLSKNACMAQPYCPSGQGMDNTKNACMAQPYCQTGMNFDYQQNKCVGQSVGSSFVQSSVASISGALQNIIDQVKHLIGQ